jgi:ribosomal-protein-alanine N-acetyltransferase
MTPQHPTIRRARREDVAQILEIERGAFIEPWEEEVFLQTLEWCPRTSLVADLEGGVVGFLVGCLESTGESTFGHISNLAVRPGFRNRGIGSRLVLQAERQFQLEGAGAVLLEVRTSNTQGQSFYRALQYQDVYRIHAYYSNGEDAIVMMKELRF